ncbi:hypothetical protein ABZT17_09595 [Streptomyces sp. NPDC005648]|uniref:hypothetical protein n=1 Tax=Streptomyces sp. NPDC005648 TaxID=3157044 RepID=UPI00339FB240
MVRGRALRTHTSEAAHSGRGCGEAIAITWSEADLDQKLIEVTQQIDAVSYEPYSEWIETGRVFATEEAGSASSARSGCSSRPPPRWP